MPNVGAFGKSAGRQQKKVVRRTNAAPVRAVAQRIGGQQRRVVKRTQRAPVAKVAQRAGKGVVRQQTKATARGVRAAAPSTVRHLRGVAEAGQSARTAKSRAKLARAYFFNNPVHTYEDSGNKSIGGRSKFPYAPVDVQNRSRLASYQDEARKLWPEARRHLGLPKGTPMPKVKLPAPGSEDSKKSALGWVYGDDRKTVYVRPDVARRGTERRRTADRDEARAVLLHEWAHTRQKSLKNPEGGATAFEDIASRKAGLKSVEESKEYRRLARKTRRKGRRYILDSQFKGDR